MQLFILEQLKLFVLKMSRQNALILLKFLLLVSLPKLNFLEIDQFMGEIWFQLNISSGDIFHWKLLAQL